MALLLQRKVNGAPFGFHVLECRVNRFYGSGQVIAEVRSYFDQAAFDANKAEFAKGGRINLTNGRKLEEDVEESPEVNIDFKGNIFEQVYSLVMQHSDWEGAEKA